MYNSVVILFDGSEVSELILQYVPSFLCSAGAGQATLLQALEQPDEGRTAGKEYLKMLADRVVANWDYDMGTLPAVNIAALPANQTPAAVRILNHVREDDVDAIMMTSRGWFGPDWWATGSTARQIIRGSPVPVYVARLQGGRFSRPGKVGRILLPLDGSLLAERAIPYAEYIANTSGASLTLMCVNEPLPLTTTESFANVVIAEMDPVAYLATISEQMRSTISVVESTVREGPAGLNIAEMAETEGYDLIVMTTHGLTGRTGGAFGGVTERVLHGCHVPVLVIPPRRG